MFLILQDRFWFVHIPFDSMIFSHWIVNLLWSLDHSISPQISGSILADLNNFLVWVVLNLLLILNSFSLLFKSYETVPPTIGITVISGSTVFSVLRQDLCICLSFHFLLFSVVCCLSGWDSIIHLSLKVPEKFMCRIF